MVLQEAIAAGDVGAIVGISISSVLVIVNVVVIARQPESKKKLTFKVCLKKREKKICIISHHFYVLVCELNPSDWFCTIKLIIRVTICVYLFQVPLVPWIPALSAFINLYLMFNLSPATWIRFSVWMALGKQNYFFSMFISFSITS